MTTTKKIALYIHIPFCRHICYYCDFCHLGYSDKKAYEWFSAFKQELQTKLNFRPYSIYLGGGTPTSLNDDLFKALLELIYPYVEKQEYTIEINPETLNPYKASLLRQYGINRVSLGLESSNDKELAYLGRKHNFRDVKEAVSLLKNNGIDNISLDILYSFPNQSVDSFIQTIKDALDLKPKHLSLYSLTIEENTVFYRRNIKPFDEDKEAVFYETAVNLLNASGYIQYEVANFCLAGYESKHNLVYWHYEDFLGLSMGASSKLNNIRSDNTRSLQEYLAGNYCQSEIVLDQKDMMFEFIMMNLRLKDGFAVKHFNTIFNTDLKNIYADALAEGIKRNWLKLDHGRLFCLNREILNSVLLLFLD